MKHHLALAAACGLLLAATARSHAADQDAEHDVGAASAADNVHSGDSVYSGDSLSADGASYAWPSPVAPWYGGYAGEGPTYLWLKYPGGHLWANYCDEQMHQGHCRGNCGWSNHGPVRLPAVRGRAHCDHGAHAAPRFRGGLGGYGSPGAACSPLTCARAETYSHSILRNSESPQLLPPVGQVRPAPQIRLNNRQNEAAQTGPNDRPLPRNVIPDQPLSE